MSRQEKQCCEATISLYTRGKDALRPDRMPEALSLPALCGQEIGLPGDDVTAGREPGGSDVGDQFSTEVRWLTS